jgi:hypothetical protein
MLLKYARKEKKNFRAAFNLLAYEFARLPGPNANILGGVPAGFEFLGKAVVFRIGFVLTICTIGSRRSFLCSA